jgi:hypothetical protein
VILVSPRTSTATLTLHQHDPRFLTKLHYHSVPTSEWSPLPHEPAMPLCPYTSMIPISSRTCTVTLSLHQWSSFTHELALPLGPYIIVIPVSPKTSTATRSLHQCNPRFPTKRHCHSVPTSVWSPFSHE